MRHKSKECIEYEKKIRDSIQSRIDSGMDNEANRILVRLYSDAVNGTIPIKKKGEQ